MNKLLLSTVVSDLVKSYLRILLWPVLRHIVPLRLVPQQLVTLSSVRRLDACGSTIRGFALTFSARRCTTADIIPVESIRYSVTSPRLVFALLGLKQHQTKPQDRQVGRSVDLPRHEIAVS